MQLFDVSRSLSSDLAPWPGDASFHFDLNAKIADGATVNLGAIGMSVHNGTHADASFHFASDGETIDAMPLEVYVGPATVVDLSASFAAGHPDARIKIADLENTFAHSDAPSRLIVKTNVWPDSRVFPKWIPTLADDVPEWLATKRVKLLALDLPSVDAIDAKQLRIHHALRRAGIAIVESLDLANISAGRYNFSALPLKIARADGAPVRAVLWRD